MLTHFAMNWKETVAEGVLTIYLSGEIDLQHSPKLRQLLQSKAGERVPVLLLDFTDVRYSTLQ